MKFKIVERTEKLYTASYYGVGMVVRDVNYYDLYKDDSDSDVIFLDENGFHYLEEDWKLVRGFSDFLEAVRYKNELEKLLG